MFPPPPPPPRCRGVEVVPQSARHPNEGEDGGGWWEGRGGVVRCVMINAAAGEVKRGTMHRQEFLNDTTLASGLPNAKPTPINKKKISFTSLQFVVSLTNEPNSISMLPHFPVPIAHEPGEC